ncbi:hypothetical protein KGF54_002132 [Candida jiufengensis]|uniref:uncharacterized protein n=1 Tax=Candida jiufengensis TaxID=497108 RepID=UPI00222468B4|nr:uncharacterized protein KGF54_002132 [Candida jiufengensis]KAI5954357.1 hypothetical protein KGF54_002132 [Candida jiufengensis]
MRFSTLTIICSVVISTNAKNIFDKSKLNLFKRADSSSFDSSFITETGSIDDSNITDETETNNESLAESTEFLGFGSETTDDNEQTEDPTASDESEPTDSLIGGNSAGNSTVGHINGTSPASGGVNHRNSTNGGGADTSNVSTSEESTETSGTESSKASGSSSSGTGDSKSTKSSSSGSTAANLGNNLVDSNYANYGMVAFGAIMGVLLI